jgi:hypothetical protein
MAKPQSEIELEPDAWQRFERAVTVVAKSPPQHRVKGKAPGNDKATPGKKRAKARAREPK